ncbi:unnamed protein product [Leptosia nina]|uniref:Uncharacterized protein n=1 Tax=Leptosia nina TaxID=320188 RepID=A0AAV1JZP9_9NEOP
MLKTTLSKIKRVCSIAFIPRILQGDIKYAVQKKFIKHSVISPSATKTTSSANRSHSTNSDKGSDGITEENLQKCVEENLEEEREKCKTIISKIFPPGDPLYATFDNNNEELTQKVENLTEAALVEPPPKLDDHGRPKVLGQQEEMTSNQYYTPEPENYDAKYDDLANRCLTTPPSKVDERILKELGVNIPNYFNDSPRRPTESYYSRVLYGQTNSMTHNRNKDANKTAVQNVDFSNLDVINIAKAELIQPLIFDSVSLCECFEKNGEACSYNIDKNLHPAMNPYEYSMFPFNDYGFEELIEKLGEEEESMMVTTGVDDKMGNNSVMPPAEMEIEKDQTPQDVKEKLKGAVTGLGIPSEPTMEPLQPISNMSETIGDAFVYTKSSSGPPTDWLSKMHRRPEKHVKPNTAISSKNKKEKQQVPTNSSISENQNPNDIAKMTQGEKYVNERPDVTSQPDYNNLQYATNSETCHWGYPYFTQDTSKAPPLESASNLYIQEPTDNASASASASAPSFDKQPDLTNHKSENQQYFDNATFFQAQDNYNKCYQNMPAGKQSIEQAEVIEKSSLPKTQKSENISGSVQYSHQTKVSDKLADASINIQDIAKNPAVENTFIKTQKVDKEPSFHQTPVTQETQNVYTYQPHTQDSTKDIIHEKTPVSYIQEGNEGPNHQQNLTFQKPGQKVPLLDKFQVRPTEEQSNKPLVTDHPETEHPKITPNVHIKPETLKPNMEGNITATGPIPDLMTEDTVTLKELLRRIRERHRQELCRDYYNQIAQMSAETSTKSNTLGPNPCKTPGKEKPPQCPPPPKCPPTTQKDPCAPKKDPCAPKKDPCGGSSKKNPCAKFSLIGEKIHDSLRLLRLYCLSDCVTVQYQPTRQYSQALSAKSVPIHTLVKEAFNETHGHDIILARDYEPWTPIPSWPLPKKEKERPFVCPKEGCKPLPPAPFKPAFKDKPCVTFPKKTFSFSDFFEQPVTSTRE